MRVSPPAGSPAEPDGDRGLWRPSVFDFRVPLPVVKGALLGLAAAAGLVLVVLVASAMLGRSPKVRPEPPPPPSGRGTLVMSDFEGGRAAGWVGRLTRDSPGQGRYSLSAERSETGEGLAARLEGASLEAGSDIEIGFLIMVDAPGALAVELEGTEHGRPFLLRRLLRRPETGEWAVARLGGEDLAAERGRPLPEGALIHAVTIAAPSAEEGDRLAVDAFWLWTGTPGD